MRPSVDVLDTSMPAWAKVLGVQMSKKVPPPPSVTQRLGYWLSQRRFRWGAAGGALLYGFWRETAGLVCSVPAEKPKIIHHRGGTCHPLHRNCAGVDAIRVEANTKQDI